VFDLDRTLWDGILLEGRPGLRLRPNVEFLLAELDRRGILLSVASKNQPADALAALRDRHIDHYFLHPQIGWGPKSEGLRRIAARLNIGIDTLAFVDDSEFERAEVAAHLPEVLVLPETALSLLHRHPLMQGSSSEEAPLRRLYYRDEAKRQEFQEASGLDYEAFLRSCEIVVVMSQPAAADIDRLHELVQRTNQLNFSGTRYGREDLAAILADPGRDVFVMRVRDRFGDYGLVGLAVIVRHPERPRLIDLALSCRVQGRQVEHGVLATLADHYRAGGAHALDVVYRRTARNAPAGQVFDDLGFTLAREEGERRELSFALARPLAPPAHLAVEWAAAEAVASAT
jgi:FkbH-like protein